MTNSDNNSTNFNLPVLWDKIKTYAKHLGRSTTRQVLLMYYVLKCDETPKSDKVVIYSALVYLVLPISLISFRRHPLIGWFDEAASIAIAFRKIRQNITPIIEYQADQVLDRWFPVFSHYEIVE